MARVETRTHAHTHTGDDENPSLFWFALFLSYYYQPLRLRTVVYTHTLLRLLLCPTCPGCYECHTHTTLTHSQTVYTRTDEYIITIIIIVLCTRIFVGGQRDRLLAEWQLARNTRQDGGSGGFHVASPSSSPSIPHVDVRYGRTPRRSPGHSCDPTCVIPRYDFQPSHTDGTTIVGRTRVPPPPSSPPLFATRNQRSCLTRRARIGFLNAGDTSSVTAGNRGGVVVVITAAIDVIRS